MWWNLAKHGETSVLGETCDFVGNVSYEGVLEVLGRVHGDLVVSGTVVVGSPGYCTGSIKADTLEIHGLVHGNVEVTILKIASNAQLVGNAIYQKILMAEGATFVKVLQDGEEPASEEGLPKESYDRRPRFETVF